MKYMLRHPFCKLFHKSTLETQINNESEENTSLQQTCMDISNTSSRDWTTVSSYQSDKMSIILGIFVAIGGFLFGYDTGLINSIIEMEYVKKHIAPNSEFSTGYTSILVSSLSMGTFIGALSAPFISDSYGRKFTIIFGTFFIFIIGNSLQVAANEILLLIIGRVISGISIGLISAVVPLYQGEAAKKWFRGAIISTYQWAITWGLLVSSAVCQGTRLRDDASSYRIPIGLQYIWSISLGIGMLFLPESPRYYILKDKLDKAATSLSFLRGVPTTDLSLLEELVEIKANYDYEMSFGTFSYLDCFKSSKTRVKQRLRLFTGVALQAFQQFSGINFIFYYGVTFLNRTGIYDSYLVSLITYAVNVIFNIPGLFFVEFLGRRRVLLGGGVIMAISNFIIAIVGCSTDSIISNKVMIIFICVFIAAFSSTWGGVVWVVSAELYPLGLRSKSTSICVASNWIINFVCAFITPYIIDTNSNTSLVGPKIFFIWGSLNVIGTLIVYLTVYETSGLTLEEIDELYKLSPNSRSSSFWNKKIKASPSSYHLSTNYPGVSLSKLESTMYSNDLDVYNLLNSSTAPPKEISTGSIPSHSYSECPVIHSNDFHVHGATHDYVDLGNGLGLTTYHRAPPSVLSDSNNESDEGNSENSNLDHINQYMAQIMTENSHVKDTYADNERTSRFEKL